MLAFQFATIRIYITSFNNIYIYIYVCIFLFYLTMNIFVVGSGAPTFSLTFSKGLEKVFGNTRE